MPDLPNLAKESRLRHFIASGRFTLFLDVLFWGLPVVSFAAWMATGSSVAAFVTGFGSAWLLTLCVNKHMPKRIIVARAVGAGVTPKDITDFAITMLEQDANSDHLGVQVLPKRGEQP